MNKCTQLFLTILFALTTLQLHAQESGNTIIGNGYTLLQYRHLDEFNSIEIRGDLSLFITQGDTMPIIIEADDNLLQYIITEVKNGTLYIHIANNMILKHSKGSSIFLSTPNIHSITAHNGAVVQCKKVISGNSLIINADSSSSISVNVNFKTITLNCGKASLIKLKGHANQLIINDNSSGTIDAGKLQIQNSTNR